MSEPQQGVIPHLVVDGAAAAIEFYKQGLGAIEVMRVPSEDGKRLMHAELRVNGAKVYLVDHFPEFCLGGNKVAPPRVIGGTSVTMHLDVPDCDAAIARAQSAGATVAMPANDAFWGVRYGVIVDPFGHCWSFAHPLPGAASAA